MDDDAIKEGNEAELRRHLQERYEGMWSGAIGRIREGKVDLDPLLASRQFDRRRCYTVIARPSPAVRRRVAAFLEAMREAEPDQYYYAPGELHVTVLSLFTATTSYASCFAREKEYIDVVDSVLRAVPPIALEFCGVTVSPGAVLIQGFFQDTVLNDLRDALRSELRSRGLAETIDARYRLETAHMTVARFRSRLVDGKHLAVLLAQFRSKPFGVAQVGSLSLVKNDWYMTDSSVENVKRYRLR